MSILKTLRERLARDVIWKRFRTQVRELDAIDVDKYLQELKTMHKSRTVRVLGAMTQTSGKKVGDAVSQEIAVRSRCTEIILECIVMRNLLNAASSTLKKHVEANYPKTLKQLGLTTVTQRRNILQALTDPHLEKLDTLNTVIEIADLIVADIDQAGFGIKHINEALAVATRREFGI